ncbi:hypothetical protein MP638_007548 [Amoeboaphelidium occidentale]|nr:hypothetical protein MP638_007548 [Amoeboaphelidium occidentale]
MTEQQAKKSLSEILGKLSKEEFAAMIADDPILQQHIRSLMGLQMMANSNSATSSSFESARILEELGQLKREVGAVKSEVAALNNEVAKKEGTFAWAESVEDSKENRANYLAYIRNALELDRYRLFFAHDVATNKKFFRANIGEREISGTTDVVISVRDKDSIQTNAQIIFELKKPGSFKNTRQVELELLEKVSVKAKFEFDPDYEKEDGTEKETKLKRMEENSRPTFKAVRYRENSSASRGVQDSDAGPVDVCRHLVKQRIRRYPGYGYQWPASLTLDLDQLIEEDNIVYLVPN